MERRSFLAALSAAPAALLPTSQLPAEPPTDTPTALPMLPIPEGKQPYAVIEVYPDGREKLYRVSDDAFGAKCAVWGMRGLEDILPYRLQARPLDLTRATMGEPLVVEPEPPEEIRRKKKRSKEHAAQYALAKQLTKATRGKLKVEYDPDSTLGVRGVNDETSRYHVFAADFPFDEAPDMNCDDRDGNVATLLADECRRVAKMYARFAKQLDAAAGKGGAS